jgi:hypothetical protein
MEILPPIPLSIVKLLVGYFAEILTEEEHDTLDEWVGASDENMRVFEKIVEYAGPRKDESFYLKLMN